MLNLTESGAWVVPINSDYLMERDWECIYLEMLPAPVKLLHPTFLRSDENTQHIKCGGEEGAQNCLYFGFKTLANH